MKGQSFHSIFCTHCTALHSPFLYLSLVGLIITSLFFGVFHFFKNGPTTRRKENRNLSIHCYEFQPWFLSFMVQLNLYLHSEMFFFLLPPRVFPPGKWGGGMWFHPHSTHPLSLSLSRVHLLFSTIQELLKSNMLMIFTVPLKSESFIILPSPRSHSACVWVEIILLKGLIIKSVMSCWLDQSFAYLGYVHLFLKNILQLICFLFIS